MVLQTSLTLSALTLGLAASFLLASLLCEQLSQPFGVLGLLRLGLSDLLGSVDHSATIANDESGSKELVDHFLRIPFGFGGLLGRSLVEEPGSAERSGATRRLWAEHLLSRLRRSSDHFGRELADCASLVAGWARGSDHKLSPPRRLLHDLFVLVQGECFPPDRLL